MIYLLVKLTYMTSRQIRDEKLKNATVKAKADARDSHMHLHEEQIAEKKKNHWCEECHQHTEQDDCCS